MGAGDNPFAKEKIYLEHLKTLSDISFTAREIDIITCILHNRGEKKIAFLLAIAPKTVSVHVRNIMIKLNCSSKDQIIDFAEKSGKLKIFRQYYSNLLIITNFESALTRIGKLFNKDGFTLELIIKEDCNIADIPMLQQIQKHLKLANISMQANRNTKDIKEKTLYINLAIEPFSQGVNIIFEIEKTTEAVKFNAENNYYFLLLELLANIINKPEIKQVSEEFKKDYQLFRDYRVEENGKFQDKYNNVHGFPVSAYSFYKSHNSEIFYNLWIQISYFLKKNFYLFVLLSIFIVGSGSLTLYYSNELNLTQASQKILSVRSDLILPVESTLLNRFDIINEIKEKFQVIEDRIKIIALIGPGGAGKTILARQYTHQEESSIIWEINSETRESLKSSFEDLAEALATKEKKQEILIELKKLQNQKEREEKIIHFVKTQLLLNSNWFLIYDNVENLAEIQEHLPRDFKTWGNGKIILTTRDSNIQTNKHVNDTVLVGELAADQKNTLFAKIMHKVNTRTLDAVETAGVKKFLDIIPSYPLDITIAAYYLKLTNTSFDQYLEKLKQANNDFDEVQSAILKEIGNYTKTRYSIITLSLQHLIESCQGFEDLVLFVSMLDSQNIPRDILDKYKASTIVDKFIFNLKKYSLVTNESSTTIGQGFSIHRSTQAIMLAYLAKKLNLKKSNNIIQPIISILEQYLEDAEDKEDALKFKALVSHYEMFLSHNNLLSNKARYSISLGLGCAYYYLGEYRKTSSILEPILEALKKDHNNNHTLIVRIAIYLGHAYTELYFIDKIDKLLKPIFDHIKFLPKNSIKTAKSLADIGNICMFHGDYETARTLLERSIDIYRNHSYEKHIGFVYSLSSLGCTYVRLGKYAQARTILEQSLAYYETQSANSYFRIGAILCHLGNAYIGLGQPEKAKDLFERSYTFFLKVRNKNHTDIAWVLMYTANAYRQLGNHAKAIKLLELSLSIYSDNKLSNAIIAPYQYLGEIYMDLGNYSKAREFLEKSLICCKNYFGNNHVETAKLINSLGESYFLEGNIETAEKFFHQALLIFQKVNHPDIDIVLENLSKLNIKKSKIKAKGI